MTKEQQDVLEFHRMIGLPRVERPTWPAKAVVHGRLAHVFEEMEETEMAWLCGDWVGFADGLIDTMYTLLDLASRCGLDVEPIWNAVHKSNMTKDCYFDATGEWIKPPTYEPPNLESIVAAQLERGTLAGSGDER